MLTKPPTCEGCPLHATGRGWVPDKLATNHADYILLGEAPGKNEIAQGVPFIGDAGYVLMEWLMRAVPMLKLAYDQGRVTVANTLRCLPPEKHGRAYPTGQEKLDAEAHCRQYDQFGDAQTVVLLGESPQRCFFGSALNDEDASDRRLGRDVKGVSGRIGREILHDGRRWVFAPHPAWILRQPAIVEHGQRALQIAANTERPVDVDVVEWDRAMGVLHG